MKGAALAVGALLLAAASGPTAHASRPDAQAVELGPGVVPPELLSSRSTKYPRRANPAKGSVIVRALIDTTGRVRTTEVVSSSNKQLSEAAVAAIRHWRYTPAQRGAAPIDVWITETFRFIPPDQEIAMILACDPATIEPGTVGDLHAVVLPELLGNAQPVYTGAMAAKGKWAHVLLQCVIDVCGRVRKCEATESSGPEYTASAIEAVEKRLYRPASAGGKPVSITFSIRVDFGLR